jgi:hypothetical protein
MMTSQKARIALLTVALGLYLIALPLTMGWMDEKVGFSDLLSGLLLLVLGFLSLSVTRAWSGWGIGIVGVWLQLAPLVFWAPVSLMYFNDTLVGAIAIVFAFLIAKKTEAPVAMAIPNGWSYNPSGWHHRIPTVALAMLCWFFSRYMAAYQLGYIDQIWDPFFPGGTLHVITSTISKDFPVSDAGMGALCYSMEALLGWQACSRRWLNMPWLVFVFGFLVIPVGAASITLIILQPVVVGYWCSWCLATAFCMLLMIVLTAGELVAVLQLLKEAKEKKESVWKVFWQGAGVSHALVQARPRSRHSRSLAWGFTLPWNLLLSAALGIWLMASPALLKIVGGVATSNYILGPMIVAVSIIACAEVFRALRFLNSLLGLCLLLTPFLVGDFSSESLCNNLIIGIAVITLCRPKGKVSERYGAWERFIF